MVASAAIVSPASSRLFLYGKRQRKTVAEKDVLEAAQPFIYKLLEINISLMKSRGTVIRFKRLRAWLCDFADQWIFGGAVCSFK